MTNAAWIKYRALDLRKERVVRDTKSECFSVFEVFLSFLLVIEQNIRPSAAASRNLRSVIGQIWQSRGPTVKMFSNFLGHSISIVP